MCELGVSDYPGKVIEFNFTYRTSCVYKVSSSEQGKVLEENKSLFQEIVVELGPPLEEHHMFSTLHNGQW